MVEISMYGSGEGPGTATSRAYSTLRDDELRRMDERQIVKLDSIVQDVGFGASLKPGG
jgi:hypothetical protein